MVLGVRAFSLSKHVLSPGDASLDVIGNPSCGRLDWFMASRKTVSSCLAKVQSAFPYSQIFLVGGLVSLGGALNLRVTCTENGKPSLSHLRQTHPSSMLDQW